MICWTEHAPKVIHDARTMLVIGNVAAHGDRGKMGGSGSDTIAVLLQHGPGNPVPFKTRINA
jgi:hypothetical protein